MDYSLVFQKQKVLLHVTNVHICFHSFLKLLSSFPIPLNTQSQWYSCWSDVGMPLSITSMVLLRGLLLNWPADALGPQQMSSHSFLSMPILSGTRYINRERERETACLPGERPAGDACPCPLSVPFFFLGWKVGKGLESMPKSLRWNLVKKTKINKQTNKGTWGRCGVVIKEKISTSGTDSNLETQWGLPITNDHIITRSQGRGWERLLKYRSSGAGGERSFLKRGPCQVSLESQKEKKNDCRLALAR